MDEMMNELRNPEGTSNPRTAVAGAIDSAADRLHDKADAMSGGRLATLTERTANALDATGRYVREFDTRDVMQDLGDVAKRHPGKSMLAAIALGFLFGRAITRPQA
jgi:hypothetical protein